MTEEKQKDSYSVLPAKARDYVRRAENTLLKTMSEALSVPFTARREFLAPIIRTITNEYLEKGSVSAETVNALFQQAYAQGIVADEEYFRQYEHIKKHLRDTAVTLSERDRSDIADFTDFRRRAGGAHLRHILMVQIPLSKKIYFVVLCMTLNSRINHGEAVYIIKTTSCISSIP